MLERGVDWGACLDLLNGAALLATEWAGVVCLAGVLVAGIRRRYTYRWSPWFVFARKARAKYGLTSVLTWGAVGIDAAFIWAEALWGITRKAAKAEVVPAPDLIKARVTEAVELAVEAQEAAKAALRHSKSIELRLDALANVVLSATGGKAPSMCRTV